MADDVDHVQLIADAVLTCPGMERADRDGTDPSDDPANVRLREMNKARMLTALALLEAELIPPKTPPRS
jgi:hypothetical protein